jgi:nucleoid-associated protein YgaU
VIAGVTLLFPALSHTQGPASGSAPAGESQITLRKNIQSRDYQGKAVEGEERTVGRGDSLWRILIQEKGLPEKRFRSYLVVIRGLNPQVKDMNALRVGDAIFIPLGQ